MEIFTTVTINNDVVPPPSQKYIGWRVKHKGEPGADSTDPPFGEPEVRPSANAPSIKFTKEMQLLSYDLTKATVSANKWRIVYENDTAFTNGNGYNKSGDPRADFVNGINITSPLPKLMKAIVCGGSFLRGSVVGDTLTMTPGVHAINAKSSMPSIETVIKNNWYFYAVTWHDQYIHHFPQGDSDAVLIPYFLKETVSYPLSWFQRWESETLPDPLKVYHTQ